MTEESSSGGFKPLTFNPDEFAQFVVDQNLSDEQATALLATIWEIMVAFVDLGFGVSTTQSAVGRLASHSIALADADSPVLKSRSSFRKQFEGKAVEQFAKNSSTGAEDSWRSQ